jgi:alpha-glucoside transport system permease protein
MDPLSLGASILLAVVFVGAVALLIGVFFFELTISWPDFVVDSETTIQKFGLMVLVVLLFIAVMTFILFVVDRPKNLPKWAVLLGFLGPTFIMIVFGLIWPAVSTTIQSFFGRADWSDVERREFVGFDNYVQVFTQAEFLTVLRNTLLWVVLVPLLAVVIGMIYAVIVDRTRTEALSKALVFLPMAISMVGASIIWKFVYEFKSAGRPQIGLLNQVLVWLGLDPYQFLLNAPLNTFFLIVVMIWIQTGFAMTVLSASIKAIPDDIIEAARLDGVTGLQMFRFVTVPSIRPSIVVVITTVAIVTLKVFDIVRTMTGGQFQTSVVANEFYTQSFTQFNFGLGAALAVVLFLLVVPIIVYNVRQMRMSEDIR